MRFIYTQDSLLRRKLNSPSQALWEKRLETEEALKTRLARSEQFPFINTLNAFYALMLV